MFPSAPLVVIDPVDPGRNVAAVVAQTSLSRFIFECRRFLRAPSTKFFFSQKRQRTLAQIGRAMRPRGTRCLLLSFRAPQEVPDVLWPQLKKTAHALERGLQGSGLSVFGLYHWSDGATCAILFELDRWESPGIAKALGPSVRFAADAEAFVKKHSGALSIHLEHDRIVAIEKRQALGARAAISALCRRQEGLGVPRRMGSAIGKARILEGKAMLRATYREMLSDYFFAGIA
jgi:tRNA nucleotidyltransferase (CCA-adding enzyme)